MPVTFDTSNHFRKATDHRLAMGAGGVYACQAESSYCFMYQS